MPRTPHRRSPDENCFFCEGAASLARMQKQECTPPYDAQPWKGGYSVHRPGPCSVAVVTSISHSTWVSRSRAGDPRFVATGTLYRWSLGVGEEVTAQRNGAQTPRGSAGDIEACLSSVLSSSNETQE